MIASPVPLLFAAQGRCVHSQSPAVGCGGAGESTSDAVCQQLVAAAERECGRPLLSLVLDMTAQHADIDSRFGAMRIVRGMALFPSGWGLKSLLAYPGFLEFLLQS